MILALLSMMTLDGVQSAACKMHGLGAVSEWTGAGVMAGPSAMTHAHSAPMQDTDATGCDCTCIGACTMVAPLAASPTAVTLRVALVAPQSRRTLDQEPAVSPPREPDRLLPFSNGPPASTLV